MLYIHKWCQKAFRGGIVWDMFKPFWQQTQKTESSDLSHTALNMSLHVIVSRG